MKKNIAMLLVTCVLAPAASVAAKAKLTNDLSQVPMHFDANVGQVSPPVQFTARGKGYGTTY